MSNYLYIVSEDNHGILTLTDSYEKAIDFLFENEWICPFGQDSATLKTYFKSLTVDEFNDFMNSEENDEALISIDKRPFNNGICVIR